MEKAGLATAGGGMAASPLLSGCVEENGNGNGTSSGTRTLKIGVIQPYSGIVGYWGRMSTRGFLSGFAHRYDQEPISLEFEDGATATFEANDTAYEMIFRDTELEATVGEQVATDLVLEEEVDMLFGGIESGAVTRIIENVAKPTDTPYIIGASANVDIVSDPSLCGRSIFRANEHSGMEARALAQYIGEETDVESVYLMAPDDVFGNSFIRVSRAALEEQGIEITGERQVPPGFSEFRGVLRDIDNQNPDALSVSFTAETLPNFVPAIVDGNASGDLDLRLHSAFPGNIAMNLVGDILESTLGEITEETIEDANIGGLSARYFWNQYDNPINDEFVPSYTDAYGSLPDFFTSGTFTVASAISQAVDTTDSVDIEDVIGEMHGMTVEQTPKGEGGYVFRERNNQARSDMTIAKILPNTEENWDAPIMPSEPLATMDAEDIDIPENDPSMECDLR